MTLYSSALAPAVRRYSDGQPMPALTDNTTGVATAYTLVPSADQAATDANFATLAAYIGRLIAHLNNGRTT